MMKKRMRIRPFRIALICLSVAAIVMLARYPAKAVSLERQQTQLELAAAEYYEAQSKYNQLNTELSEVNTADYIERTARRDHGYCWYGETIYVVGNLDEIRQEPEFEVYTEN